MSLEERPDLEKIIVDALTGVKSIDNSILMIDRRIDSVVDDIVKKREGGLNTAQNERSLLDLALVQAMLKSNTPGD